MDDFKAFMANFQAFAWECKDYADGWVRYFDEQEALAYQRDTGCIIRVVYRPRPGNVVPSGSPNLLDCTKPEQDAEGGTM